MEKTSRRALWPSLDAASYMFTLLNIKGVQNSVPFIFCLKLDLHITYLAQGSTMITYIVHYTVNHTWSLEEKEKQRILLEAQSYVRAQKLQHIKYIIACGPSSKEFGLFHLCYLRIIFRRTPRKLMLESLRLFSVWTEHFLSTV